MEKLDVTDAGLAHLSELKSLRTLYLKCDKITDAGLVHLKELVCLQKLELENTKVTDEGVVQLKQWLPTAKVLRFGSMSW